MTAGHTGELRESSYGFACWTVCVVRVAVGVVLEVGLGVAGARASPVVDVR